MTKAMTDAKVELAEHWENQCNRYVNGECRTRRCLVRGGYSGTGPCDSSIATCEEHESATIIRSVALEHSDAVMEQDAGVPASPSGSRPADRAASTGVSPVPASIPNAEENPFAAAGEEVMFLADNGYPFQLEAAMKLFEPGQLLTVETCSIGSWENYYRFRGVEGAFNTVMFRPYRASAIEARRAETQGGSVADESAVPERQTPEPSSPVQDDNAETTR